MWKRIFGSILFVWMTASAVAAATDKQPGQGMLRAANIASAGGFAAMALIGLVVAVAPAKRVSREDGSPGQDKPPASP